MAVELDHLSYSSISSYLACPANWKFHYLDKIPTATSPELVFGSAFHSTIEEYVGTSHQCNLLDVWHTNWALQMETNKEVHWNGDTPESMCNLGVRMFTNPDVAQGILSIKARPDAQGMLMIERKIELRIPGVGVPVIGYIDVIAADGVPGDFKTSSRAWTTDKALNEMQPVFYLAALNQLGIHMHNWRFRHYVFVKTKTPQFQMIEHVHGPAEIFWLFGMIQRVWDAIEKGCFPPNPTGWKCSPQYCDYWSICRGKNG